jgi:6-phosphogluconolactonase (cycloisomerase 2 family)
VRHPSGKFLLAPNADSGSLAVFAIDAGSGALGAVSGSPFPTDGTSSLAVAAHPTRNFVYVTNANVVTPPSSIAAFQINPTSGELTPVPGSPFTLIHGSSSAPSIDPSGKFLYTSPSVSQTLQGFAINPDTGALTAVPGAQVQTGSSRSRVSIDPSGRYLYCVNSDLDTVSSYAINPTTGALTMINTVSTGDEPSNAEIVGLQ